MSLMLITPPAVEPLTLAETKAYLRVEHDGNQSDAVSRATFAPAGLGYNWPPGYPLPKTLGLATLPLVTTAALSRKEA